MSRHQNGNYKIRIADVALHEHDWVVIKPFTVLLLILCPGSLLVAQLVLPDAPDEDDHGGFEIFVPGPERTEGLHSGTSSPAQDPQTQEAPVESIPAINLLQLRNQRRSVPSAQNRTRPGSGKAPLEDSPPRLKVRLEFPQGAPTHGQLRNQPILIETFVGRVIVPLHEIASLSIGSQASDSRIDCRNGDTVQGVIVNAHFDVQSPDGASQRIPTTHPMRLVPLPE